MRKTGIRSAGALTLAALFTASAIVAAQKPGKQKPRQVPHTGVETVVQTPADVAGEAVLEQMTSRSSQGLVEVVHADGTVSMDLQGRFMNVMLATPATEGGLTVSCETGPEALKHAKAIAPVTAERSATAAPVAPSIREVK